MPVGKRTLAGLAATAVAVLATAVPASGGSEPAERATKTVAVGDDYFAPTDLKIAKNTKVKWKWEPINLDTHDVVLTNVHPKKVKRKDFKSAAGSIGVRFARKFEVPGKYEFVCTFHSSVMRMNIQVKR